MFIGKYHYHEHIRKAIIAFGLVFNNISVNRKNTAGEFVQSLRVPLSYGPKQKFISRIQQIPDVTNMPAFEVVVPRMGFEMTSLAYDSVRKLAITQRVRAVDSTTSGVRASYISTPYNMGVTLSILTKNQEDGLQIIEQILPHFNPDFNVTISELPELGVKKDIQIVLDNISYSDEYEGDFSTRTVISWDLNFTVKLNMFGFVDNANLIKKSIQNVYADYAMFEGLQSVNAVVGTRITTTPDPEDADPSGPYGFIQEFDAIYGSE